MMKFEFEGEPNLAQMREILKMIIKDMEFKDEDIPDSVKIHFKPIKPK